jgi:hypothetical protein
MKKKRNYGGRLPLSEEKKKSNAIRVRLSADDVQLINTLHDCSHYKTLSELVRHILLQKPIHVQVKNIELYQLEITLNSIDKTCSNAIKSKKLTNTDLQPILSVIKTEVLKISNKIDSLQIPTLSLKDLEGNQPKKDRDWQDYWYFG